MRTQKFNLIDGFENWYNITDVAAVLKRYQSINQSINVFQGKTQTEPFTNIYKHILFLHDIIIIIAIMKTIEPFE